MQWVNGIIETAQRKGIDRQVLLTEAGIILSDHDLIENQRLPLDDTVRIWRAAIKLSDDPHFGLSVGENSKPSNINVVSYLVMSSATLRDALSKVKKFRRLVSDGGYIDYVSKEHESWVVFETAEETLPFTYHQAEAVLVVIYRFARLVLQGDAHPTRVMFCHAAPGDSAEHERIFHCPVVFNAEANAIVFDDELLDKSLLQANDELSRLHEIFAEQMLAKIEKQTLTQKVYRLLEQRMAHGPVSRDIIASQLAMSERSLQRKLKQEDTSFQEIVDNVRLDLAESYLQDRDLSLQDIAALLGFSEVSTFYRAYKRWTGHAPRQSSHIK